MGDSKENGDEVELLFLYFAFREVDSHNKNGLGV